jgi:hypothetical protein
MTPAARALWRRYHLLTVLLPVYAQALLCYGAAAWAMAALPPDGAQPWLGAVLLAGAAALAPLLRAAGYLLSGLEARRCAPQPNELERLNRLQAGSLPRLQPVLLELGPLPFLAVGGRAGGELFVSRHAAAATADVALACLLAHEQAHASAPRRAFGWAELTWLAAGPLCWLARDWPLAWLALAALHVSLWLRWQGRQTAQREAEADRRAAAACGVAVYAPALAAHLAQFEAPGSQGLRRARLAGLGLRAEQIIALLEAQA